MDGKKCPHNSIHNVQNFQNVNNREVIILSTFKPNKSISTNHPILKKSLGLSRFQLVVNRYICRPIFVIFFIYRHRPISVISSAALKSDTSAGSAVLLVRWNVRCCCMWRTPSQNFWNIPCLPVLSTPLYVCYVWAGWWLISLVLVTKWQ